MTLEAILYTPTSPSSPASLRILDQLLLPHRTVYISIASAADAFSAIKSMQVRGAPAIALVAALSLAVVNPFTQLTAHDTQAPAVEAWYVEQLEYLKTSRPTAVNLGDAVAKLKEVIREAGREGDKGDVWRAYVQAAEKMLEDDVRDNEAIGKRGAEWIRERTGAGRGEEEKVAVLTHCNTGSLATAGYGTALGIVRALHTEGVLGHTYYTETRPYNQGSRLTGYELLHDKISATLITDSMAAALFRTKAKAERIVALVVGADRVARNGDTANKIGTYQLACLARLHGLKFLVAAPRTTIDLQTATGDDIEIEERAQEEVLAVKGPRVIGISGGVQEVEADGGEVVSTAAIGTTAWNPAFDVTPAALIDGIVTEVGVAEKSAEGRFELEKLFE